MNITKRNGKWQYDFRYNEQRYRKGGFRTKREAEYAGNERYNDASKGIDLDNKIAFSQYTLEWIETYKKPYISAKTYKDNYRIYEKIFEYFDDTPINKITRPQYQKFLTEYKSELSQDQLGRIHALCKKVIENAIYDGLLIKNFTFDITVKSTKAPNKQETDKYLNIEELTALKKYYKARTHHLSASTHIILLMIETGGRYSDCINLKREDINETKNEIFLNGTKNRTAPRHVVVSKELIKILINYANKRPTHINKYLFAYDGKQITNATINKSLKEACTNLGIKRKITSHAFRHTVASYLIYKGINIYYISKYLGHSDISVTLNKYGHLLKESLEEDKERTVKLMENL
ncbi:tyrosine-type recombinase/integrase [Staphylococcus kloosii]|uniref:Site-specific integrase n=1 Tax=Staphylococcus kloosii TaxID=29384 RepID=A0ABQ0XM61_9STAP|nr:tyrosine-type recombinase/integrase [Staphylococcus kloosii]AVQ35761.1 integrase [Staphylococcus kloosii]PNZ01911.1 integrase [Staphylococcus kloosii]GEP82516.1 site-specific integrase [Staphylococcus kloosii]SUM48819.1 integrase [Staphylococcus kloosii]